MFSSGPRKPPTGRQSRKGGGAVSWIRDSIRAFLEQGDRLLLALDTTAQRLAAYGGEIGLRYLLDTFYPRLAEAGFSAGELSLFSTDNCRRLFAG